MFSQQLCFRVRYRNYLADYQSSSESLTMRFDRGEEDFFQKNSIHDKEVTR